ncbi:MAG: hypothetical protein ABR600_06330 [Actinomycetota bacterium]
MPARNRVTPFGEIVGIEQRGLFMGNRGSIHKGRTIVRPWQVRRWITCVLEYKGWSAPRWEPGRWTPLFFWDEAVALAAGHRPCALCRRADFNSWLDAWAAAFGERPRVDPIDRRLHAERLDGNEKRRHRIAWKDLPQGAFVVIDDEPMLVTEDRVIPWSSAGYGPARDRPRRGDATVLTPPSTVAVLANGYRPRIRVSESPRAKPLGPLRP